MTTRSGRAPALAAIHLLALFAATLAAAGCSAGGDVPRVTAPTPPPPPPAPAPSSSAAAEDDPGSLVLGVAGVQDLQFVAASGAVQAQVIAPAASTLLQAGANPLTAEHDDAALPGVRVACVSAPGDTTNVVTGIDLGVIGKSAAILFATGWTALDSTTAWSAAVAAGGTWNGWENCGLKPEGLPSPSSQLRPASDGGYAEDVMDGNPGTTFNVVSQTVPATQVTAMLSDAGFATTADPTRPLVLTLRAFSDGAGHQVFVERGEPAATAPAGTAGFLALYEPAS